MGNKLRETREFLGLSRKELAQKTNTTVSQIGRLESDDPDTRRQLTEASATTFARALGVQPGDLMPVISDGSVPVRGGMSASDKIELAGVMAKAFELHTDLDTKACQHLGMAAVKMYLMAASDKPGDEFYNLAALKDSLSLEASTDEEGGS